RGQFGEGLRNFELQSELQTTPELSLPFQPSTPHSGRIFGNYVRFNVQQARIHSRLSIESGLEPGTQPRPYH
ncbi:hypothetical protein AVEN_99738-1, partial [Araneus ventricosus]